MKKRMLITTESLTVGGVETSLLSFIKALKSKYEIDLFVLKDGELKNEFEKELKINYIKMPKIKSKLLYRIKKNLPLKSLYKKYKKEICKKYDVSIAYYGINNYCDLFALAAPAKKRFIWVHNNMETGYKTSSVKVLLKIRNNIIKQKYMKFDNIISVSESAKKGFQNIMKLQNDKVIVINNLIDLNQLDKKNEKCDVELIGNNKLIYVGRLVKSKNVDKLLYEFIKIKKAIEDAKLYIIGDGPERNTLNDIIKSNKIKDVYFLGFQQNPFKYMNKCEIIVTASESEAYPTNLIEALALNKYFVSRDNDGAKDVFEILNKENVNNGIICNANSIGINCINYLKNKENIKPNFNINDANKEILEKILILFE